MKKILLILVAVVIALSFTACGSANVNTMTDLKKNEVLVVGGETFINAETVIEEEDMDFRYVTKTVYTLNRTLNPVNSNYVEYNGYYYYWTQENTYNEEILGKSTTTETVTFSYLPILENEKIAVKKKTVYKTSYNYSGGWVDKSREVEFKLGGYFYSYDSIVSSCPALAEKIDAKTTVKYYIDVTTPDYVDYEYDEYNSYYYFEKK